MRERVNSVGRMICDFVRVLCILALLASVPVIAADVPKTPQTANSPKPVAGLNLPKGLPPVYARIVIDSLHCVKESKWDHGSSQDEPYVMVTGFASHREPNAWILGRPEVFSDVDTGNNRRFNKQNKVVYEGEVPKGAAIGFHVVLWERDSSPQDTQYNLYQQLCRRISDNIMTCMQTGGEVGGKAGAIVATLYGSLHSAWVAVLQQAASIAGGGGDDKVAEAVVGFDYDELVAWTKSEQCHRTSRIVLDGGDEGKYWLRYHIEFVDNATWEFGSKFTEWDDMATGNVDRILGDEIVTVSDEDGPGDNGRFCVYDGMGKLIRSFDAPYAPYDRFALADTSGNGVSEILVVSPFDGGLVRVCDHTGASLNRMAVPFAKYDGFAAGDVNGDGKAEIVIARSSDRKVYIHTSLDGRKIDEFGLNWQFNGTRYTSKNTRHNVMLVGDVMGDDKAEIIMIENKNNTSSVIRVYNDKGAEVRSSTIAGAFGATFTHNDAAALGDMYGDGKKELILGISDDEKTYTYTMYVLDLVSGKRVGSRSWPWYLRHSGFAAGTVVSTGKAQIVVANGTDKKIYVGR